MPNHVINRVIISGSKESIAKCSEQIFKGGEFSFMNILPMPEELNMESGSLSHTAMEWMKADKLGRKCIEKKYGLNNKEGRAKLQRYADNVAKYGYPTWYEWRCNHWGTKWDAYEISGVNRGENSIGIEFWTAWSTPFPAFEALAEQYTDLTIDVDFADEDLGVNCGSYGFCDGETWDKAGDYYFACELWGEDPVELEECEEVEAL